MPENLSTRGVVEARSVPDGNRLEPTSPRVYVVSDIRLYRDGLVASLGRRSELVVVGSGCASEVLDRIEALQPEALLLDLAARNSLAIPQLAQRVLPKLV